MRTRFAPSPTGDLHIGGVRTALFNFLLARHNAGQFVLRIEDTDRERSTEASINVILEGMKWLGLSWDEGPSYQMEHLKDYQDIAEDLVQSGHAYRCDCSPERLETVRAEQMEKKEKTRYDGHCIDRAISKDAPHVVRFKTPKEGVVTFHDLVRGDITVHTSELDDLVMVRQDGVPTYNFAVVVDDHKNNISHVVRGDDHINNTPRQIVMYQALGWDIPAFAHVPMILGQDGKRLSKRHGATNVLDYQKMGYLPAAVLNYLIRLGWSHGDQEIFSLNEMIEHFDLKHISHSPAAISQEKLDWLNQHYMKAMDPHELAELAKPFFEAKGYNLNQGPALDRIVALYAERAKTLVEMAELCAYFYRDVPMDEQAQSKFEQEHAPAVLAAAAEAFTSVGEWDAESIKAAIHTLCESLGMKMGQVGPVLRAVTTRTLQSPDLSQTLAVMGKALVLQRLTTSAY